MPAEIGLDRRRDLARLQRERSFGKLRDHLAFAEIAEVAAIVLRTVETVLLGEIFEFVALL